MFIFRLKGVIGSLYEVDNVDRAAPPTTIVFYFTEYAPKLQNYVECAMVIGNGSLRFDEQTVN